jgi:hypothetical protein
MKALFAGFLAMLALSAKADDMQKYLADTQEMVRQGKHQEALDRFIWFHGHALEHDPAMGGVRLSFALMYWKSLGDVFPPATTAMVELRDRTTQNVTDKQGTFAQFHDVMALNRTLAEDSKTVDLFQTLDQTQPDLARQCWIVAKDAVIKAKRYDLVRKYFGNPARDFVRIKAMYDLNTKLYDKPNVGGPPFKAYNDNHFVEESLQLIEVALALDNPKAAKEVQEKALAVVDDQRLRDAISAPSKDAQE